MISCVLFLYVPELLQYLGPTIAARYGITIKELAGVKHNGAEISATRMVLEYRSPALEGTVDVENVRLTLSSSLRTEKRFESIIAGRLSADLSLHSVPPSSSKVQTFHIPFQNLEVEDLKLSVKRSGEAPLSIIIQGGMKLEGDRLSLLPNAGVKIEAGSAVTVALLLSTAAVFSVANLTLLEKSDFSVPTFSLRINTSEISGEDVTASAEPDESNLKITSSVKSLHYKDDAKGVNLGSKGVMKVELPFAKGLPQFSSTKFSYTLRSVGGSLKAAKISEGSMDGSFEYGKDSPFYLTVPNIDAGVSIEKIIGKGTILVTPGNALLKIQKGSFRVLDGQVNLRPTQIQAARSRFDLPITVAGIQLEKLFELYPTNKVNGTGSINADLPLVFEDGKWLLQKGTFASDSPGGKLSVDMGGASGISRLGFASDILKNFNYSTLSGTASIDEDGRTLLSVAVSGSNPSLRNSQPVNLNLNIEENMYQLFKSLNVAKRIDEQVQRNMK